LLEWCDVSERKVVLIIDEVDTAANNQVFLDFLADKTSAENLIDIENDDGSIRHAF
jgi:hypothetical protein